MKFIIDHTLNITLDDFCDNELLLDSVMFRLIQISENSDRIDENFKSENPQIMWRAMKGMRNRIVHDYGEVDLGIVYKTVKDDIPLLHIQLSKLIL